MKPYTDPPMTLGSAAAAKLRLMVWCKACGHRSEPDPTQRKPSTAGALGMPRSDPCWALPLLTSQ